MTLAVMVLTARIRLSSTDDAAEASAGRGVTANLKITRPSLKFTNHKYSHLTQSLCPSHWHALPRVTASEDNESMNTSPLLAGLWKVQVRAKAEDGRGMGRRGSELFYCARPLLDRCAALFQLSSGTVAVAVCAIAQPHTPSNRYDECHCSNQVLPCRGMYC